MDTLALHCSVYVTYPDSKNNLEEYTKNLKTTQLHPKTPTITAALEFEPNNIPAVFCKNGSPYEGSKSSLLPSLKKIGECLTPPSSSAVVVDLSHVMFYVAATSKGKSFAQLFDNLANELIRLAQVHQADYLCVVTDRYDIANPLKQRTDTGTQLHVTVNTIVPDNIQADFMRNRRNKKQLYDLLVPFLYNKLRNGPIRDFAITYNEKTLGKVMPDCNHHEADYRLVLFVQEALRSGHNSVAVLTGDTDVLIILAGHCQQFVSDCPQLSLHVTLRAAGKRSYFDLIKISNGIGLQHCKGFLVWYAYTGCDYTPFFYGVGKVAWFKLFNQNPSIKQKFQRIAEGHYGMEELMDLVNFTLNGYGVDPSLGLAKGRFEVLMRKKTKTFRSLPPSPGAAVCQALKAVFIAVHVWGSATNPMLDYGAMTRYGWMRNGNLVTHRWTARLLEDEDIFCKLTKFCGCKLPCSARCGCSKGGSPGCAKGCKCACK